MPHHPFSPLQTDFQPKTGGQPPAQTLEEWESAHREASQSMLQPMESFEFWRDAHVWNRRLYRAARCDAHYS